MPDAAQVDLIVEDQGWGDPTELITDVLTVALWHLGLNPAGFEISVLLGDDARIADLNARFRDKPSPTNVLSWPAVDLSPDSPGAAPHPPDPGTPDDPTPLGDIALALGVCRAEAEAAGKPLSQHLSHLVVHALLHLLGHDHETEADALLMEGRETAILAAMGIPDPYGVAPEHGPQGGLDR